MVASGKRSQLAGWNIAMFNTSSIRAHFSASYVRLPECSGIGDSGRPSD